MASTTAEAYWQVAGGRCFTEDLGIKLENVTLDDLGKTKRVTIDKENTTIVGGKSLSTKVQKRYRLWR